MSESRVSLGFSKIFRNFSWLLAERILVMVVALTVGIYTVRYLGANNFGQLSYAYSFVSIFDGIAKLGLDAIVIRSLVKNIELSSEILGTTFILKAMAIAASMIISTFLFFSFNQNTDTQIIFLLVALSLIFNVFDVIDFWFQAKVLSKAVVIVRFTQVIVSSTLKLVFIYFKFSVFTFAGLYCLEGVIKMLGLLFIYRKHHQYVIHWRFRLDTAQVLLRDAWPLILSGLMVVIYVRIDQVMLGMMTNETVVGIYAAAIRFSEVWYFIPVIICSSVFPAIVKMKSQAQDFYLQRLQYLYDFLMWVSLLIALGVSWVAYPAINILLGKEYYDSALILIVHIWALPFVFLGVGRSQWLVTENLTHFSFLTSGLGALANIVLNGLLIPNYQGMGAAIATVISYAIAGYFSCLVYQPTQPMFIMLSKALLIPVRLRQNWLYICQVRSWLQSKAQ